MLKVCGNCTTTAGVHGCGARTTIHSNKSHSINKVLPCKANVAIVNVLVPPHELMPATSTVYPALGSNPCSVTLVLEVFIVE